MCHSNLLRSSPVYRRHWLPTSADALLICILGLPVVMLGQILSQTLALLAATILAGALCLQIVEQCTSSIQFFGLDILITRGQLSLITEPVALSKCTFWKQQSLVGRIFGYGDFYLDTGNYVIWMGAVAQIDSVLYQAQQRCFLAHTHLSIDITSYLEHSSTEHN